MDAGEDQMATVAKLEKLIVLAKSGCITGIAFACPTNRGGIISGASIRNDDESVAIAGLTELRCRILKERG